MIWLAQPTTTLVPVLVLQQITKPNAWTYPGIFPIHGPHMFHQHSGIPHHLHSGILGWIVFCVWINQPQTKLMEQDQIGQRHICHPPSLQIMSPAIVK